MKDLTNSATEAEKNRKNVANSLIADCEKIILAFLDFHADIDDSEKVKYVYTVEGGEKKFIFGFPGEEIQVRLFGTEQSMLDIAERFFAVAAGYDFDKALANKIAAVDPLPFRGFSAEKMYAEAAKNIACIYGIGVAIAASVYCCWSSRLGSGVSLCEGDLRFTCALGNGNGTSYTVSIRDKGKEHFEHFRAAVLLCHAAMANDKKGTILKELLSTYCGESSLPETIADSLKIREFLMAASTGFSVVSAGELERKL